MRNNKMFSMIYWCFIESLAQLLFLKNEALDVLGMFLEMVEFYMHWSIFTS